MAHTLVPEGNRWPYGAALAPGDTTWDTFPILGAHGKVHRLTARLSALPITVNESRPLRRHLTR